MDNFPRYILEHKYTKELYRVIGVKTVDQKEKYILEPDDFFAPKRLVDKLTIEIQKFYDIIGYYD